MNKIKVISQEEWDSLPKKFDECTVINIHCKEIEIRTIPGNSSAILWGNSSARLRDNSSAALRENSSAELWENSSAKLWGNSSARLWGNSSAKLRDNSSAVLWNNSSAVLLNNSSAELYDNSSAVLWNNSSAELRENSSAELWDNSSAGLRDNSSAVLYGNSSARLRDNSSARLWNNSSALLYDNSSARLWNNSSAVLRENSSAVLQENSSAELWDNSSAVLLNNSSAAAFQTSKINNYFSKEIKAYDNAAVYCHNEPGNIWCEKSVNIIREIIKPTFDQWLERGYVVADGIHQELVSKKTIGDVTIYETKDFKGKQFFVAQKGEKFAHAETIEEAKNDLRYKISDRDKSKYKEWRLDDVKPADELIEAYRVITGACETGVKLFCQSVQLKEEYSIKEAIELTKGKYGHESFASFWSSDE